jgi:hypothetical protein
MSDSSGPADVILLGGRVITVQPDATTKAEGVVVRGDRIVRTIARGQAEQFRGPDTKVVDLGNRPILPGFVDVHAHAEVVCRTSYGTVDCRAPECGTVADVQDALSTAGARQSEGEWIVGQANLFFDRKLKEGRLPTREELDAVSRTSPIALRAGGHITVLNTKALEVAGIDRNFVTPEESVTGKPEVVRDSSGNPTGIVKEMDVLLPFPPLSREQVKSALKEGIDSYFTQYGVTTIGEISETVAGIECMNELAMAGELSSALRVYLWSPGTLDIGLACEWPRHINLTARDEALRIQGVKLFSDGGFSAKSAAVNCCYVGQGEFRGDIAFPKYFLRKAFERTQAAGLQLSVHANGDRAQEWVCQVLTGMGGGGSGRTRLRIEHAGNLMPQKRTSDWWARAGIIPVPQPVFLYTFGEYFEDYLGEYGTRGRFPFRSLIEEGWRLSGSSDVWIGSEREATNPLFSIWCCLKRQTYSGGFIDEHEAITLDQAIRMHTLDAAATMGEDDLRGSIAPGKLADIIALDRDPYAVSVDEIRQLKVDYVMSLGRTVRNTLT